MRTTFKATLALALVAVLAAPALAQRQPRPGQGGPGGGGPTALLTNKSVQEELKMTEEQVKKATALGEKSRTLFQEKTKDIPRDQIREKFPAILKEINETLTKEVNTLITSEQQKRLKQITLQSQGSRAFSNEETQKALALTDEQKEAIKTILDDGRKASEEAVKDIPRTDFAKQQEARAKVRKETMGKVAAKLTAEQKKTWKEMTGEPFEIKFEAPRPGGGGRPGGGRPGGAPRPPRVDL